MIETDSEAPAGGGISGSSALIIALSSALNRLNGFGHSIEKLREMLLAAAEVGERDRWQLAELGVACVSADGQHADEVLAHVLRFVERSASEAQLTDVATELIRL